MISVETSPLLAASSFVSQIAVTYGYKHPDVKWISKENVKMISAVVSSAAAVATAWASGTLDNATVETLINVLWNALLGSGLTVGFYEWTKPFLKSPEEVS